MAVLILLGHIYGKIKKLMKRNEERKYRDRYITIAMLGLMVFGLLMIASAEMGNANGDISVITEVFIRQTAYLLFGLICYSFMARFSGLHLSKYMYYLLAIVMGGLLLVTRLFGSSGGAYAWIRLGIVTVQPAEFAKVFMILLYAKTFSMKYDTDEKARANFRGMLMVMLVYTAIILVWQSDLGTAVVLFAMSYLMLLVVQDRAVIKYRTIMMLIMLVGFALIVFLLSPLGTLFLESLPFDSYMIDRFISSANPFADQYNTGYHLIMSLVSFATGGLFGVGYGKSVHKYMNFPNPSSDFILPVIVEELGMFGLAIIVVLYGTIFVRLARYATRKSADQRAQIVFLGTFMYFALHLILNVGGVTGLIPLTGLPLLMISSGGSSAAAAMAALGAAQNEIVRIRKLEALDATRNRR